MLPKVLKSPKTVLATVHRTLVKDYEKAGKIIWVTPYKINKIIRDVLNYLHLE